MKNKIYMKLNIQFFADKKEVKQKEVSELSEAEQIAELTISLDIEKQAKDNLNKDYEELKKKYEDEHNANLRLMNRISAKEEQREKEELKVSQKKVCITDFYDFESGRLTIKK